MSVRSTNNKGERIASSSFEQALQEQPTKRRGRMTNAERAELERSSFTYNPNGSKVATPTGDTVIAFLRLSRKDDMSIGDEGQREAVYQMMRADGVDMDRVEDVYEVGSAWRKGKHRPRLDEILHRCKRGEIKTIYAYELSRLTRDPSVANTIVEVARASGVHIRIVSLPSLDPTKDDFASGIIYNMLVQQAKAESDNTSLRTKREHWHRAQFGIKRCSVDPVGLRSIVVEHPLRPAGVPVFVIDSEPAEGYPAAFPSKAHLVREIFRRAGEDESYNRIAKWLNALKIPTQQGGEVWQPTQVRRMVMNPLYAGYGTYHGEIAKDENGVVQAPHEALIQPEQWHALQARLKGRGGDVKPIRTNAHRLTGVIYCTTCGSRLPATAPKSYRCLRYAEDPTSCSANSISYSGLETAIYELIIGMLGDRKLLAERTTIAHSDVDEQIEQERAELRATCQRLQDRLTGETDEDVREAIGIKLGKLEQQLGHLNVRAASRVETGQIIGVELADIMAAWREEDRGTAQRIVRSLIRRIDIDPASEKGNMQWRHLARIGWPTNLDRVTITFHNGEVINLGTEARKVREPEPVKPPYERKTKPKAKTATAKKGGSK